MSIPFFIQILALIALGLATLGIPVSKITWGWLGMTLWLFSLMVGEFSLHQAH